MKMFNQSNVMENLKTIAVHEAGHAVAGVALGRKFTRLSIIPVDGEPRGCKWSSETNDVCERMICDLAGARAQLRFCPDSVSPEQNIIFRDGLLLSENSHSYYSKTGWQNDLVTTLGLLKMPEAPIMLKRGFEKVSDLAPAVDVQLKSFFDRQSVANAVILVSSALLQSHIIKGHSAAELISNIESQLLPDDYIEVRPQSAR